MKKRFTEEQIIAVLKEAEAGTKVSDLSRNTALPRLRSTTGKQSSAA